MFGFILVKKQKLYDLEHKVDELFAHVMGNAGFADENGKLTNGRFNINETRKNHWLYFHELYNQIGNMFTKLHNK